jgi:hypothetical protein
MNAVGSFTKHHTNRVVLSGSNTQLMTPPAMMMMVVVVVGKMQVREIVASSCFLLTIPRSPWGG